MTTLYKNSLKNKALELKKEVNKNGLELIFDNNSFIDYLVEIVVKTKGIIKGSLLLYYKPTKNTYSLKIKIKDAQVYALIDSLWNKINGFETYSADSGIYEAFVDGSYINGITGYGAVIYLGEEIKAELSGTISNTQFRQFGGELKSVIETLKWCIENNVETIRINYDYDGIEKFASGKWKAGNEISKAYVDFIRQSNVKIEWRHIKSHTGNIKNDKADLLAKCATNKQ
ncbi:MAG: reverse transcriptase-like protein [Endomicrobium sp.]|jgi:ribonuclease HI|nr:reverse transcriptase-like protein [Endomicrobium sp.]